MEETIRVLALTELMRTNRHKPGNMAVLVNAPRTGLHTLDDVIEAASMPELSRQSAVTA